MMKFAVFAALIVAVLSVIRPAIACPIADVRQAVIAQNLENTLGAHQRLLASGDSCTAEERAWSGDLAANMHRVAAEALLKAGGTIDQANELVKVGLAIKQTWMLHEFDGLLMVQRASTAPSDDDKKRYWRAAGQKFECALVALLNEDSATIGLSNHFARLRRQAEDTEWRAKSQVRACGRGTGTRGVDAWDHPWGTVGEIVRPIQFPFDSDEFTDFGREVADDLATTLLGHGYKKITLIGHTDPVGKREYNWKLSLRRANRLKEYLVLRGYPAELISVEGRADTEPVQFAFDVPYDQDTLNQILRRVVLRRE